MKLINQKSELKAIKSICNSKLKIQTTMLGAIDKDYFYYEPCLEAYKRIVKIVRNTGEIPEYSEVCTDPAITEDFRKTLSSNKQKTVRNESGMTSLLATLSKYRKLRLLYENAIETIRALKEDKTDIDEIIQTNSNNISEARLDHSIDDQIFHIGEKNNTSKLVKEILYGDAPRFVPTGFKEFDEKNDGLYYGSLLTIAATTGGGKSAIALQLLKNMAESGNDVAIVPLEMSATDTLSRYVSNMAGIELGKIMSRKLAKGEKQKVKRRYKRLVNSLKENGNSFTIFDPKQDMTIEEILFILKPYNKRVILIDYISLLKGTGGDNSWQQLGDVARYCKVWAKNNDQVVIMLAQLASTGDIRYAKSIIEHSSNAWTWVYTEENKTSRMLDIRQIKSRNQQPFPFKLAHDYKYMQIRDPTPEEKRMLATEKGDALRSEMDGYLDDLSEDD